MHKLQFFHFSLSSDYDDSNNPSRLGQQHQRYGLDCAPQKSVFVYYTTSNSASISADGFFVRSETMTVVTSAKRKPGASS